MGLGPLFSRLYLGPLPHTPLAQGGNRGPLKGPGAGTGLGSSRSQTPEKPGGKGAQDSSGRPADCGPDLQVWAHGKSKSAGPRDKIFLKRNRMDYKSNIDVCMEMHTVLSVVLLICSWRVVEGGFVPQTSQIFHSG